jgi:hypothetical protein
MTGILDRVARSSFPDHPRQFRPASTEHFVALRLAQRLNDAGAVHHYVELCDRHAEGVLLTAYRQAMTSGSRDLARSFHAALEGVGRNGSGVTPRHLAAIRIERRAIAVAIFNGGRLKYPPIARQLSSDPNKALGSAAMFIDHIGRKCSFTNAAVEVLPDGGETQRSQLAKIVKEVLVQRQVVISQFAKAEILAAFGYPPLRFRSEVREVISAMWPEVNGEFGSPLIKDALALGLYCQVEHLLGIQK